MATYKDSENIYRDVSQNDLGRFNSSDDHAYRQIFAFIKRHESEAPSRSLSQAQLGDPSRDTPPIRPIRGMKLLCLGKSECITSQRTNSEECRWRWCSRLIESANLERVDVLPSKETEAQ